MKLMFDYIAAIFGLLLLWPIILFGWIGSSISTRSNGVFFQTRIGRNGKKFRVYKLKTMIDVLGENTSVTALETCRITKFGYVLRKFKIDELPQLVNIILGDMSFVGPRPDVEGYADRLVGNDRLVLNFKPGITGPASLLFKFEENLLNTTAYPLEFNNNIIYPIKVKMNLKYLEKASFLDDIDLIIQTIFGYSCLNKKITPLKNVNECLMKFKELKC